MPYTVDGVDLRNRRSQWDASILLRFAAVTTVPHHYVTPEEDSHRWLGFRFRPGDIVISTRRRTGTTWLQMICALLIFQRPELPAPLWQLSPWLDHRLGRPEMLYAQLEAQPHRRFIKTHTPLDGLPYRPDVTYLVCARHPLDMFVSLRHQLENIDGDRMTRMSGLAWPHTTTGSVHDDLSRWLDDRDGAFPEQLPVVMWHLTGAWTRRHWPNVLLVHYDDLVAGLEPQMRHLAWRLGIGVPEAAWPSLVAAAGFDRMRDRAGELVPAAGDGMFRDSASFFRRGTPGAREVFSEAELDRYRDRVSRLAPADLLEWLHAPRP
jgi:aryl sulfotransferase